MMGPAHQDQVVEPGRTACQPVSDVVAVAPSGAAFTSRKPASPIPHRQRPPECGADGAGSPPDVEWLGSPSGHDSADRSIAEQPPNRLRVKGLSGFRLADPTRARLQGVQIHQHRHVGLLASATGPIVRVEKPPADLDQRVGSPLGRRPRVGGISRSGIRQCLDSATDDLTAFGIELTVETNDAFVC